MRKLMLLTLLMIAICSCRTRTVYLPLETRILDSIIYHDTTFREKLIPYRDSVAIPDTVSVLSNPYAYSYAKWSNGMLYHSLGIYPFASVIVKVPYFMEKIRRIEVPKPYPVEKSLTKWQWVKIEFGGWAFGIIIALILIAAGKSMYRN